MTQNKSQKDWQIGKLGEICKIVSGNTPKGIENISNTGNYQFYKVSDMNSSGNEVKMTRSNYNLSNEEIVKLKLKLYPKGTVIFPKRGGAILTNKKRVLSKDSTFDLNLMGVLPNENVNSSFLFYWFINLDLGKICDGSNIPQINNKNIAPLDFPLPPLETQQAIVSKIEELFSELDKGIEDLKTAQQQLKTYRQSVLKWAFEGKLTNENVKNGELPKGWEMSTIGKVSYNVEYGSGTKSKKEGKIPVLRMGNIQNGIFDWNDLVYSDDDVEINKYLLKKNDVLFNRTNSAELVGKTAIYKGEQPAIFAGYLIRINRIEELIDASYLTYYLNTKEAKKYGNSVRSFGVNQSNINGTKLKTYPIPLPLLEEQHQIVQEIESRLSVADKMEESIVQSLQQAEALRQSILNKAFSGELV